MSNYKFMATNRERFMHQKTQEFSPYDVRNERKNSDRHRELLVPIDKFPRRGFLAGKSIRSEGKSLEKNTKMPAVDVFAIKESLLLKKEGQPIVFKKESDSLHLKNNAVKKINSNRMITEKLPISSPQITIPVYPTEKKASVTNKILVRGGAVGKELSPSRRNMLKLDNEKAWIPSKNSEGSASSVRDSSQGKDTKRSLDKRLSPFELEESAAYEIYYIGPRRIYSRSEFTDAEGDPKVAIGDAIAYKYEIVSQLGRGSFGKVFKAYDHKKEEYVALKIIKSQEKFTVQAKVEVEILETVLLHDPKLRCNVVRLKGSFVFRGHSCLKFEILHKNLYEFIKENNFTGFSLDLIRRFAIQILQALLFFKQFNIIHCDIKPENILLKEENKSGIKLIDVGSGCFENKQIYTYIQSRFYRAPEIILGVKYTAAIDMWSLGCVLVELYTGVPIFPGETENEQMLMFMQLLGLPPSNILARAERRKKFFTENMEVKIVQQKGKEKLPKSLNWVDIIGECDSQFVNFLERCFDWEPNTRLNPKEALLHEWILEGLPKTIRQQHVEQLEAES